MRKKEDARINTMAYAFVSADPEPPTRRRAIVALRRAARRASLAGDRRLERQYTEEARRLDRRLDV